MLESIRTHQRALQLLLLLIIFPSFAFFGIQSYTGFLDKSTDLVKVNGEMITASELEFSVKKQGARYANDPTVLSNPRFKQSVLNELIQQKLVAYELKSLKLQAPDTTLAKILIQIPEIAALKKSDGSIDQDKYRQLLASNQLTISQFEDGKRAEIKANDLQMSIGAADGGISSSKVAQKLSTALSAELEVQAIFYFAKDYVNQAKPTDSMLDAYYKANLKQFEAPGAADVQFLILKNDSTNEKDATAKSDKFANLVFEQSDSLKPAAEQLKLNIQSSSGLTAAGLDSLGKDHPLNQKQVLKAIFTDDVLKNGRNTEAIQIAPGTLLSAHVTKYNPPYVKSFESVKDEIAKIVSLRLAEDLATEAAKVKTAELDRDVESAKNDKSFGKAIWVSRNNPLDLRGEAFEKVFSVKTDKLPAFVEAKTNGVGVTVYKINRMRIPDSIDAKLQIEQFKQISNLSSQAEMAAYFSNIRERAGVKLINLPK